MEVQTLNQNGVIPETAPVNDVRFLESNTQAIALDEMRHQHIIPVFVKDNEQILSHQQFIDTTYQITEDIFSNVDVPAIRLSHPVKGRVPTAKDKKAAELLPEEKTIYYERMAFLIEIPSITNEVNGQTLSLTVGGVRALNHENLYSYKGIEKFKVFIGFKVSVCTNLCISTDGYMGNIRVSSPAELGDKIRELLSNFQVDTSLANYQRMKDYELTEQQFAHMIGRAKMYQYLPKEVKEDIPALAFGDNQIGTVVKEYYKDKYFSRAENGSIDLWNLYNLFTSANKGSYIDTFLDRGVNAYEFVQHIGTAIQDKADNWFLN